MRASFPAARLLLAILVPPAILALPATLASCGDPSFQVAERGVGGTGGSNTGDPGTNGMARPLPSTGGGSSLPRPPSDRGIGGTGMASAATANTGLVGMITGFGSVFVNGLEVGFDSNARVTMDDASVAPGALRVGQIVALDVDPVIDARSHTAGIAVRHEVAGRVLRVGTDGLLTVSGQPVRLSSATLGDTRPHVGDWIAVSGFRNPADEIAATRIDPAPRGHLVVHGVLRWDQGALHVGGLPIETAAGTPVLYGPVSVSGPDAAGALHADTLTPDLLASDPATYFGPTVHHFLIESYAAAPGDGFKPGWRARPSTMQRSVNRFERGSGGGLVATPPHGNATPGRGSMFMDHEPGHGLNPGGASAPAYGPAPVPGSGASGQPAGSAPAPAFLPNAAGGGSGPQGGNVPENTPGNAAPMRPPLRPGH